MTSLAIRPATRSLNGDVGLPSDKSIGHRALILASLSGGRCEIRGFSFGEDNVATANAFRAMGVAIEDGGGGVLHCHGVGLRGLRPPKRALNCGNSGTTMRLLSGVLAGQRFHARLVGDASLSRRPMARIADPLSARGAVISGCPHATRASEVTAPLDVGPLPEGRSLTGLDYESPVASAQVKSALLLSGLYASGSTVVKEPTVSRDHTERMMAALGIPVEAAGSVVRLAEAPPGAIRPFEIDLPGDLSAAAFLLAAALVVPDSRVTTLRTGLNPTRSGALDVIRSLGGNVDVVLEGNVLGEPMGMVTARHSELSATPVGGQVAVRAIDEIPVLCALAARARGTTVFTDVGELRVKESDRISMMVRVLRSFGIDASERADGLSVEGRPEGRLRAGRIACGGDHRIAMTAVVLGLIADGETVVDDADVVATSFPAFAETLRKLGAAVEVRR